MFCRKQGFCSYKIVLIKKECKSSLESFIWSVWFCWLSCQTWNFIFIFIFIHSFVALFQNWTYMWFIFGNTVNDRLSSWGAYLKIKILGCRLVRTVNLIGSRRIFKTNTKIVRQERFSQKIQNSFQNFFPKWSQKSFFSFCSN